MASIINEVEAKFISTSKCPLLKNNNTQPKNAIRIPVVLFAVVLALKKSTPVMITKTGVKELRIPAIALSNFSSAMQNKNAGNKLPNVPDKNNNNKFDLGMVRMFLRVIGNNSTPAVTILKDAT